MQLDEHDIFCTPPSQPSGQHINSPPRFKAVQQSTQRSQASTLAPSQRSRVLKPKARRTRLTKPQLFTAISLLLDQLRSREILKPQFDFKGTNGELEDMMKRL